MNEWSAFVNTLMNVANQLNDYQLPKEDLHYKKANK
jgi:hypothetical protein